MTCLIKPNRGNLAFGIHPLSLKQTTGSFQIELTALFPPNPAMRFRSSQHLVQLVSHEERKKYTDKYYPR